MEVFRLLGLAFACSLFAMLLRSYKPEMLIPFSIAAGCMLFFTVLDSCTEIFDVMWGAAESIGLEQSYMKVIVKVIGMAYIVQFGVNISRDAGESALAAKVEMAGKLMIVGAMLPMMENIFELITSFGTLF